MAAAAWRWWGDRWRPLPTTPPGEAPRFVMVAFIGVDSCRHRSCQSYLHGMTALLHSRSEMHDPLMRAVCLVGTLNQVKVSCRWCW